MTQAAFQYLAPSALLALNLIQTPVAVYSFGAGRMVWTNAAAATLASAGGQDEPDRAKGGDADNPIAALLDECLPALRRGERRCVTWRADAFLFGGAMAAHCTGIRIDGHTEAMLMEFLPLSDDYSSEQRQNFPNRPEIAESSLIALLALCPAPAIVLSPDESEVRFANALARKLIPIDAVDGGAALSFAHAETLRVFWETAAGEGPFSMSVELIGKSGRTFAAALAGQRIILAEGAPVVLLVIQDVHDIHRASLDLEAALQIERAVSHQQRRMLDIAAHEFRTPLAVIDGAAQRIARNVGTDSPERTIELAQRIREFVSKLLALLEHTIERTDDSHPTIEIHPQPGNLQNTLAKVASYFEDAADIELAENIADIPDIMFDHGQIEQIFVKLIENAIKYSEDRARIRISAKIGHGWLELSVNDSGIGILPEDRERVFFENVRGKNVGAREGTGLGLYIVRAIVRAHGGAVSIAETSGPGTTIRIALPLRPVKATN